MKTSLKIAVTVPMLMSQLAFAGGGNFIADREIFLKSGDQRVTDHAIFEDPNNLSPWIKDNFDVVILINKANARGKRAENLHPGGPQTATIYVRDGQRGLKQMRTVFVSTGREKLELGGAAGTLATDPYVSQTPTGYYPARRFSIDHVSGQWVHEKNGEMEGSKMPFAVFFNQGKASHQVPGGSEDNLGHRASGACVRMFKDDAEYVFWSARYTGGPLTPEEMKSKKFMDGFNKNVDANGVNIPLPSEPGCRVSLKDDGSGPILAKAGKVNAKCPNQSKYELVQGFRTLYIVENVRYDGRYDDEFKDQFGTHFYVGYQNGVLTSRSADVFNGQLTLGFQDGVFNTDDQFYQAPAPKRQKTVLDDTYGEYFQYKGKTYFEDYDDGSVYFVRNGKASRVEDPRPRRQRYDLQPDDYNSDRGNDRGGLFDFLGF